MVEATLNFQPGAAVSSAPPGRIALLGNPNCGKTALFNLLTGSRQKVANYAGVTVERKEGLLRTASGTKPISVSRSTSSRASASSGLVTSSTVAHWWLGS